MPKAFLAMIGASNPARTKAASWPDLKGTLLQRREAEPRAAVVAGARGVGRSVPPSDAPPCGAEPGPEIGVALEPGQAWA